MSLTSTVSAVRPHLEQTAVDVTDPMHLRRAMGRFATGVTVVTTRTAAGKVEALTANSFTTVSLDPPLVLWSLARKAASFKAFEAAQHFVVNVLAVDQVDLCRHFATPRADKLAGVAFSDGPGGSPVLAGTLAHFSCARHAFVDGGDHVIIVGRVVEASHRDGEPLVFAAGHFHRTAPLVR